MTPISNEIRKLLIEAKKRGETEKSIAKWLKISERSVTTIWKLYRKTGSYLPTPYPGRQPIRQLIPPSKTVKMYKKSGRSSPKR